MRKTALWGMLAILALAAAFAGGNASVPRLTGERAELAARIGNLQSLLDKSREEAQAVAASAAAARAEASQAEARVRAAELLKHQAEEETQQTVAKAEADARSYQAALSQRDARITELEAKVPSSKTQVRLAAGSLFGGGVRPNARCPHCGTLLMIGEIKEFDGNLGAAGMYAAKSVTCPTCNEFFHPQLAKDQFEEERHPQPVRRRR